MHRAGQRLALGLRFRDARVVAVDVAHAELGHFLVALFHLAHGPFQRDHRLLRIGDDRREQMRNAVIDGELEHLGIDHDQAALVGLEAVDQAQDHGVDGDRFAGAGGAGDQQMRHAGEIDDHAFAADGLAEAERQLGRSVGVIVVVEQFAQINFLAHRIGQFDADGIAARHDGDAGGEFAHGARDVVGEADHARRFDAGRGLELVERDNRARPRIDDFAAHAEIPQHAFQHAAVLLDLAAAELRALGGARRAQADRCEGKA